MGNRSHVKLYSELLTFLEANGRSLDEYGSSERGLSIERAREFVDLLLANGVRLLGIEVWRRDGDLYRINGRETWYPIHESAQAIHADALQYFIDIKPSPDDVFAIQFS
jgi:hypothetical protein